MLIDEIENGIHHSKLKNIWKAIIEIVKEEKIQLFITTHDKESIEALKSASEEMRFEDISAIELYKDDDSLTFDIEDQIQKICKTFSLNNSHQEYNLIESLKTNCRKIVKKKTGKRPYTNVNLVRI